MREHLFKSFHPDKRGTTEIILNGEKIKGEWVKGLPFGRIGGGLTPHGINLLRADKDRKVYFVIAETVGQYTGLTDKNGKKIFEGDIVKITDELANGIYYARVEFGNPNAQYNWGFQLVPLCSTPFAVDILHWVDMEESGAFIEVIGNIYDNPELLK